MAANPEAASMFSEDPIPPKTLFTALKDQGVIEEAMFAFGLRDL